VAKYDSLATWLATHGGTRITASFAELDGVVGGLPPSARTDRTWWGNTVNRTRVQAHAWLGAGWQVDSVDLLGERVVFVRGSAGR
jgi:hypothetical protein